MIVGPRPDHRSGQRSVAVGLGCPSTWVPFDDIPVVVAARACQWRLSHKYVWTGLTRSPSNEYYANVSADSDRLWVWFERDSTCDVETGWRARDPVTVMFGPNNGLTWHGAPGRGGFFVNWADLSSSWSVDVSQRPQRGRWKAARVAPRECM